MIGADNCSTQDKSVFTAGKEMERSGHFAIGKRNVRIQEANAEHKIQPDIWKRFVSGDEDIDLRVNFGFTLRATFQNCIKTQEINFSSMFTVEKSIGAGLEDVANDMHHIKRRCLGVVMGRATLTHNPDEVDTDNCIFLFWSKEKLDALLNHPATHSRYFTEYLLPWFREKPIPNCLHVLDNPASIQGGNVIVKMTECMSLKLTGRPAARHPLESDLTDLGQAKADELIVKVHKDPKCIGKSTIKPYCTCSLV